MRRAIHIVRLCYVLPAMLLGGAMGLSAPPEDPTAAGSSPRPAVPILRFGVIEPPVVAQKDITVRAPISNQQRELMPLECSGIAWAAGQLLILSDRHQHVLFTCPVDLEELTIGDPVPHVIIQNEQELLDDGECLTVRPTAQGGWQVFVLCSLSNDLRALPLPKRRHMLEVKLEAGEPVRFGGPRLLNGDRIRRALNVHFEAVGMQPYRTYYPDFSGPDKNTYRWGNVEGMTFTPEGSGLLCGMRNPMVGDRAILFLVDGLDEAVRLYDSARLKVTDVFTIDLGGRGVSDLCWDARTRGYLITAAKSNGPKLDNDQPFPPNTLDSALFWWSGRKAEKPILLALVPDMKVEAVCRLGSSPYIALGSDEGDVSEGREQRQSVLTIMEFRGLPPPAGRKP